MKTKFAHTSNEVKHNIICMVKKEHFFNQFVLKHLAQTWTFHFRARNFYDNALYNVKLGCDSADCKAI